MRALFLLAKHYHDKISKKSLFLVGEGARHGRMFIHTNLQYILLSEVLILLCFIITAWALETRPALDMAAVFVFLVNTLEKVFRKVGYALNMRWQHK